MNSYATMQDRHTKYSTSRLQNIRNEHFRVIFIYGQDENVGAIRVRMLSTLLW